MTLPLSLIASYLLGAIPTGFIFVKAIKGADIRNTGSGNIGATNVVRVLGRWYGALVLAVDILKGYAAVAVLANFFYNRGYIGLDRSAYLVLMGAAAIFGHTFTIFLRFRGGKGVATSAGVLLAIAPHIIGMGLLVWLIVFAATKYVSLSSIAAAIVVPLLMLLLARPVAYVVFTFIMAAFVIYKHKPNISRLLKGGEHRFGKKREAG